MKNYQAFIGFGVWKLKLEFTHNPEELIQQLDTMIPHAIQTDPKAIAFMQRFGFRVSSLLVKGIIRDNEDYFVKFEMALVRKIGPGADLYQGDSAHRILFPEVEGGLSGITSDMSCGATYRLGDFRLEYLFASPACSLAEVEAHAKNIGDFMSHFRETERVAFQDVS